MGWGVLILRNLLEVTVLQLFIFYNILKGNISQHLEGQLPVSC